MAEVITGVAMQAPDGRVFTMERPKRHNHLIQSIDDEERHNWPQGFVTSEGRFVDRAVGLAIATLAGQLVRPKAGNPKQLYSEDMW